MTSIALQHHAFPAEPDNFPQKASVPATTGAFQEAKPDPLGLMLAIMVPLSAGFWVGIGWLVVRAIGWFMS